MAAAASPAPVLVRRERMDTWQPFSIWKMLRRLRARLQQVLTSPGRRGWLLNSPGASDSLSANEKSPSRALMGLAVGSPWKNGRGGTVQGKKEAVAGESLAPTAAASPLRQGEVRAEHEKQNFLFLELFLASCCFLRSTFG